MVTKFVQLIVDFSYIRIQQRFQRAKMTLLSFHIGAYWWVPRGLVWKLAKCLTIGKIVNVYQSLDPVVIDW